MNEMRRFCGESVARETSQLGGVKMRGTWVVLALLLAPGCVRTQMTGMRNPTAQGELKKLVVYAHVADLGTRKIIEDGFLMRSLGRVEPSYKILFPGHQYSDAQVREILLANRIEGILIVAPTATGAEQGYIPGQTRSTGTATCTSWSMMNDGCQTATTSVTSYTSPGVSFSKPWANWSLAVYDWRGESVWVGSVYTGGNAFSGLGSLVDAAASKTIARLISDRVVPKADK